MAYRAPQYYYQNAYRDRGISNITLTQGVENPDHPLVNLIDDRMRFIFKKTAAIALIVDIDLGASPDAFDFLISGATDVVPQFRASMLDDDNPAFSSFRFVGLMNPIRAINSKNILTSSPPQQYFRVIQILSTLVFPHAQWSLSKQVTFSDDPEIAGLTNELAYNYDRSETDTGQTTTVQRDGTQRRLQYIYPALTGADLAEMESMIDFVGMDKPFFVDPHSFSDDPDVDDPPLWMKFETEPRSTNALTVPADGIEAKRFELNLIEALE